MCKGVSSALNVIFSVPYCHIRERLSTSFINFEPNYRTLQYLSRTDEFDKYLITVPLILNYE